MSRTVNYSDYLTRVTALCGLDKTGLSNIEEMWFRVWFAKNFNLAWGMVRWPFACPVEQRTPVSGLVAYEQSGETPISEVFAVYTSDPYSIPRPRELPYVMTSTGCKIVSRTVPATVYVYFRKQPPAFTPYEYEEVKPYSEGDVRLYSINPTAFGSPEPVDNFWIANDDVSPGEIPGTSSKWDLVEIPSIFLDLLAHSSYADFLRNDGQSDKAALADAEAQSLYEVEVDKLERQQGQIITTRYSK